jgi:hypothetical protein
MARSPKSKKCGVEPILRSCRQLSLAQLQLLRDALDWLIAEKEWQQLPQDEKQSSHLNSNGLGANGSHGYIEAKTIKGHGPYLYLRIRRNGTHHSFYLGKADPS